LLSLRHHVFVKTGRKEVQLAEVGPRFEMKRMYPSSQFFPLLRHRLDSSRTFPTAILSVHLLVRPAPFHSDFILRYQGCCFDSFSQHTKSAWEPLNRKKPTKNGFSVSIRELRRSDGCCRRYTHFRAENKLGLDPV